MQQTNKRATPSGMAPETTRTTSVIRRLADRRDVYGFRIHVGHEAVRYPTIVVDAYELVVRAIGRQFDELAQLTERKLLEINRHAHAALGLLVIGHASIIACEGGAPCL